MASANRQQPSYARRPIYRKAATGRTTLGAGQNLDPPRTRRHAPYGARSTTWLRRTHQDKKCAVDRHITWKEPLYIEGLVANPIQTSRDQVPHRAAQYFHTHGMIIIKAWTPLCAVVHQQCGCLKVIRQLRRQHGAIRRRRRPRRKSQRISGHPGVTGTTDFGVQRRTPLGLMPQTLLAVMQHPMRDDRILMYREAVINMGSGLCVRAPWKSQQAT